MKIQRVPAQAPEGRSVRAGLPLYATVVAGVAINFVLSARVAPAPPAALAESQKQEIALALSACPPALAKGAAVYVLGPSGYVKVRESQNGFTALVQHTVPGAREPRCMGEAGARSWLPRILKVAELRAKGKSQEEIKALLADALAKGTLERPAPLGVDYMLSTQNLAPNQKGAVVPFPPHIMFYAPGLTNKDIGVDNTVLGPDGNPVGPVFVAGEGTPYALLIVHVGTHAENPANPDATASSNNRLPSEKAATCEVFRERALIAW